MHLRLGSLLTFLAILTACGATNGGSPMPSTPGASSSVPSVQDSPTPSATSEPTAPASVPATPGVTTRPAPTGALQTWQGRSLATVRVNGLNMRSGPAASEPLVPDDRGQFGAGGVVRLDAGDHVLVMGFVEPGDGTQWLQIGAQRVGPHNPVAVGWAVAGTVDDPWVEEDNSWCPGAGPTFETLVGLSGIERVGCYSLTPLTFTAHQATIQPDAGLGGACVDPVSVPWLQCEHVNYNWVNRDGGYAWEFRLHFDPAAGIPETNLAGAGESRRLIISGHFDDPAATSCAPSPPVTNDDLVLYLTCSTLFVVDSLE